MPSKDNRRSTPGKRTPYKPVPKPVVYRPSSTVTDPRELETAIYSLEGVEGVKLVMDGGQIDEIHVIASPSIKPKTLVRNIETVLLVAHGVRIDHRLVSIVTSTPAKKGSWGRPVIRSIQHEKMTGAHVFKIELASGEERVQGTSQIGDGQSELEGGSRALIAAVEKATEQSGRIELRGAGTLMVNGRELIFIVLDWTGDQAKDTLVGAAFAREDRAASAARATLDAVNRRLVRVG